MLLVIFLLFRRKKKQVNSEKYASGLELVETTGNYVMMPGTSRPESFIRPQSGKNIPRRFWEFQTLQLWKIMFWNLMRLKCWDNWEPGVTELCIKVSGVTSWLQVKTSRYKNFEIKWKKWVWILKEMIWKVSRKKQNWWGNEISLKFPPSFFSSNLWKFLKFLGKF